MPRSHLLRYGIACALTATLLACRRPQPPADDQPPPPQTEHTQLRDAMRKQLDEVKQLQEDARKAEAQRQQMLEDSQG